MQTPAEISLCTTPPLLTTRQITTHNSSFNNNQAGIATCRSRSFYAYRFLAIIVHTSSFHSNVAGRHAGVMYASNSSSITIHNSSFNNNMANGDGGVIFETGGIPQFSYTIVHTYYYTKVIFRNGCILSITLPIMEERFISVMLL